MWSQKAKRTGNTHCRDAIKISYSGFAQNYVIYQSENNKSIKKIVKHQQYRVVTKAVGRLSLEEEDNISDKGGVIWYTQGSGKSLSVLWLATQLVYRFGNPPIVIVLIENS